MTGREYRDWVESLKPGDEVCIPGQWGPPSIVKVVKITDTQVVLPDDRRYHRTGRLVGQRVKRGSYSSIQPVTDGDRELIERARLVEWLQAIAAGTRPQNGRGLTTAQLRAMRRACDTPELLDVLASATEQFCQDIGERGVST